EKLSIYVNRKYQMKKAKNSSQMKKMKYRCPKCNSVQRVEYSPIMSRTLQCDKCGARFITASSKPEADAKKAKKSSKAHSYPVRIAARK
ncbi:MAG: hypothetical protein ACYTFW_26480, partial [Planctomycetota bacterium]